MNECKYEYLKHCGFFSKIWTPRGRLGHPSLETVCSHLSAKKRVYRCIAFQLSAHLKCKAATIIGKMVRIMKDQYQRKTDGDEGIKVVPPELEVFL